MTNIELIPTTPGIGIARLPARAASIGSLVEEAARAALRSHDHVELRRTELLHGEPGRGMLTAVARGDASVRVGPSRAARDVAVRVVVTDGHGRLVASGAVHLCVRHRPNAWPLPLRSLRAA